MNAPPGRSAAIVAAPDGYWEFMTSPPAGHPGATPPDPVIRWQYTRWEVPLRTSAQTNSARDLAAQLDEVGAEHAGVLRLVGQASASLQGSEASFQALLAGISRVGQANPAQAELRELVDQLRSLLGRDTPAAAPLGRS